MSYYIEETSRKSALISGILHGIVGWVGASIFSMGFRKTLNAIIIFDGLIYGFIPWFNVFYIKARRGIESRRFQKSYMSPVDEKVFNEAGLYRSGKWMLGMFLLQISIEKTFLPDYIYYIIAVLIVIKAAKYFKEVYYIEDRYKKEDETLEEKHIKEVLEYDDLSDESEEMFKNTLKYVKKEKQLSKEERKQKLKERIKEVKSDLNNNLIDAGMKIHLKEFLQSLKEELNKLENEE